MTVAPRFIGGNDIGSTCDSPERTNDGKAAFKPPKNISPATGYIFKKTG
jgi:hypothetical protein